MHIFISIGSVWASPPVGEMFQFCDFFVVQYFFSYTRTGRTPGWISTGHRSNDVVPPKEVPFAGIDDIKISLGS